MTTISEGALGKFIKLVNKYDNRIAIHGRGGAIYLSQEESYDLLMLAYKGLKSSQPNDSRK